MYLIGILGAVYFYLITNATRHHFTSQEYPLGMYIISIISLVGIIVLLIHSFWLGTSFEAASLVVMSLSTALFLWAVKGSRRHGLKLAFDTDRDTNSLVREGPWRYTRHPFYTSYIMFWSSTLLATQHILSLVVLILLSAIYIYAAKDEERHIETSQFSEEYKDYKRKTGFIIPKIVNRNW